ncbi:DUF397 domain-containing protein [Streptomyces flavidovirens]|uniref:DUF397 domain-containing protein n=1 Tax=Streptomyces flavidovirens TaxID=67298 RepID=UPI0034435383
MNDKQPAESNWFKSSYSSGEGGACVEVATVETAVRVRDSKECAGPQLAFAPDAWTSFVNDIGRGRSN